jgi:phosphinothricin acetyltransferase
VIRRAESRDLLALTGIYNHYIAATAITFDVEPYTPEARRAWLDAFQPSGRYQLFVAELDGQVVGWAGTRAFRERLAYQHSVETSVYLAPEATGRGLGATLYEHLFAAIADSDAHRAIAGITLPNEASVALHLRFGFREVGVMHEVGRKFDRWWDVLWMERVL